LYHPNTRLAGVPSLHSSDTLCHTTVGETTIEFDGKTIFTLNASEHGSMMATYADGLFLIHAMGTSAEWGMHNPPAAPPNHIMLGTWDCNAKHVVIKAKHEDPTTGKIPSARNFPYASLKISPEDSAFLVCTNVS
jgi:hypothetical protein